MAMDFRSDTVTRPTAAMRAAMAAARCRRRRLRRRSERQCAAGRGRGAAWLRGGAVRAVGHAVEPDRRDDALRARRRGDRRPGSAHYRYEAGGGAVLGSIQPQPLDNAADGTIPVAAIEAAIKPDDSHFAKTRLIALEDTIGGKVLPDGYVRRRSARSPTGASSRCISTARAVERGGEARCRAADDRARASIPCRSACRRDWARRSARCCAVSRDYIGARASLAQDAGRRDAAGGNSRGGGATRASRITSTARRRSRERGAPCRGPGEASQRSTSRRRKPTWYSSACATAARTRFAAHLAANGVQITGTAHQRWVTHLDVARADVERAIGVVDAFFAGAR